MENQNDVPTAQSSLPNINVKVDTQIFSKIALYVFHISNFFALLSSILLVLTYGTGSPFQTIKYLFTSLSIIVHGSSIINYIFNFTSNNKKDEIDSLTENKTVLNKLILCSDVHDIIILLLFSYAGITPILYVFEYIIYFSLNFVNSTLNDILPYLNSITCSPQNLTEGENAPSTKSDLTSALDPIKTFSNSYAIKICPVIFQMIITVQIFIITLFDMTVFNLFLCIFYVVWEVMFDFATNAIYHDVWTKIGSKINETAEANIETYGNYLSIATNTFSKIGYYAHQLYK